MRRCLLLLIDGLRPDVAEAEPGAGRLPNLASLVARGGVGRAVTSFPSTTSVSYLPFFTGCTPGRCNVPSIRSLDRTRYDGRWWRTRHAMRSYCGYQAGMLDADVAPEIKTIFELVPESVGIFTMVTRGLTAARNPARVGRGLWGGRGRCGRWPPPCGGARAARPRRRAGGVLWGVLGHYAQWHQPSDDAAAGHLLRAIDQPNRF